VASTKMKKNHHSATLKKISIQNPLYGWYGLMSSNIFFVLSTFCLLFVDLYKFTTLCGKPHCNNKRIGIHCCDDDNEDYIGD